MHFHLLSLSWLLTRNYEEVIERNSIRVELVRAVTVLRRPLATVLQNYLGMWVKKTDKYNK